MYRQEMQAAGFKGSYALDISIYDFEIMQYIRQPLKPETNEFCTLLNVVLLEPHEVEIYVFPRSKIEIRVKHPLKQNLEGLWMTRDAVYTYELPESCKKPFKATWYADNFLLIKTRSLEVDEKECVDRFSLVIERVDTSFKPAIEMSEMKKIAEDIQNRAQDTLEYLRFANNDSTILVKKNSQDMANKRSGEITMVDSRETTMSDSGATSIGDSGATSIGDSPKRQGLSAL